MTTPKPTSLQNIIIRPAILSDAAKLTALEMLCFTSDRLSTAQYRRFITQSPALLLILEQKEAIIGSSITLRRKNTSLARLYSFAIHPDYQKKGLASTLLQQIEFQLTQGKMREIRLEVRQDNPAAIQFYLKNGYEAFGKYAHYYEDGANALRMRKKLENKDWSNDT